MKKLLIVDDEDAMRGLYRKRLSNTYEIFETGDAEQALAMALEHKPDGILLDLKMPKYDGFELCKNFRSLSYTSLLPIFVLTGQAGDYKKECEAMGATGYFEKPIDFKLLKRELEATFKASPEIRSEGTDLTLKVALKLKGRDAEGEQFADSAETESVSPNGFQCISFRRMEEGSLLEVFIAGRSEQYAGIATIVERAPAGLSEHRYRFRFDGEKENWILQ
ncbi:MAG: response regulator [Candidatus Sulfotelmatobacter sp.]|jgi:CheY-like chemotaxis protein